ncbi:MAG: DEAD/DEAH box helicase [Deltaproteobacteria bacterium]|nr:DEAD/DEAH box helicase [Deltaproteobacteria bacterium]
MDDSITSCVSSLRPLTGQEFLTDKVFTDFDLSPQVISALEEAGFERCTVVQERCLPLSLKGDDVAAQAQTGTGKTAAFLITIYDRLFKLPVPKGPHPRALIIVPTRELAIQIYSDATVFDRHTGLKTLPVYGGMDYQKQAHQLREGVDVIVATPGRLIDYLKQGAVNLAHVNILVIDEADRLIDMGFITELRFILRRLPSFDRRQTMMFSATLSYRVMDLTYEYTNLPKHICVNPEKVTTEGIDQIIYHVGLDEKFRLLLGLLAKEEWNRVLIFSNTKAKVEWLAKKLKANGYEAKGITGDLPQKDRIKLIKDFKTGKLKILTATDVASRGIHVEDISHVINYDIPLDREDYVHRIGRTARAGKSGKAFTLACEDYIFGLEGMLKFIGQTIPYEIADESMLGEDLAPELGQGRFGGKRIGLGRKPLRKAAAPPRRQSSPKRPPREEAPGVATAPTPPAKKRRIRKHKPKPAATPQQIRPSGSEHQEV